MAFISLPYASLYQEKGERYDSTNPKYRQVCAQSLLESRAEKEKLRAFFRDPFGDGSGDRFWNAEFTLDYLEIFKPEGKKRKDSPIENILHELKPARMMMDFCQAKVLPPEVTYEIVDGKRYELPGDQHSIERLFCAIHVHDLDEDYTEVSEEAFLAYMDKRINECDEIPVNIKPFLKSEAREDAQAMKALTFGRKTLDERGNKITENTHDGDRQIYSDALGSRWQAIAAKASDRDDGLRTRYGFAADIFTIAQDEDYMEETRRLFVYRQSMKDAQDRYPELAKYFEIMHARISIALHCLGAITSHHPTKLKMKPDPSVNAETARIDLGRFLPIATQASHAFCGNSDPFLKRMLLGFQMEALRWRELQPIVSKIKEQLTPYTPQYPSMHNSFQGTYQW